MSATRAYVLFVVGSLGLLTGCAGSAGRLVAELEDRSRPVELEDVPFHAQVTDQCGPASLATILGYSDIEVTPQELKSRVYIPSREGALQFEMLAATRQYGRIPYTIDASPGALVAELDAGRPVLVLQNLGVSAAPLWHYAVVIGYLPDERQFVLRSGDQPRHRIEARRFVRSWRRGDFWGFVALKPGELPAKADADRYLRAVAAVESTGDAASAAAAYRAASERWPQNRLAWLGLGNASFTLGELQEAAIAYQGALELDPGDAIALNNLAEVYLGQGCRDRALATIEAAMASVEAADPVRAHLLLTRQEILRGATESRCE